MGWKTRPRGTVRGRRCRSVPQPCRVGAAWRCRWVPGAPEPPAAQPQVPQPLSGGTGELRRPRLLPAQPFASHLSPSPRGSSQRCSDGARGSGTRVRSCHKSAVPLSPARRRFAPFTRATLLRPLRHGSLHAAASAACAGSARLPAPSQGAALSVRNPSARGHVHQPRKAARPAPHRCRCAPGLPCSLFLRPWLLLRLAQPWAALPALPGPACPPYPRWWPGLSVSSGRCSG